jgi:SAM-dependent methyltransferase
MANEFPAIWFDTFLTPENASPVQVELDFIQLHLPVSTFRRLLDVPCGIGRHSGPLAALGYEMLGIDRSETALAVARRQYPEVEFRRCDMFALRSVEESFDGLLCLWQSFGYGDSYQNRTLLADMRGALRPGGRLVLDIYNADAVDMLPHHAIEERAGRTVRTKRMRNGRRLRAELEYSDSDEGDVHEWEIYSPSDFEEMAIDVGLDVVVRCAWFDPAIPPSRDHLRMQFLLERRA